jgi:hypothetical protein
VSELRGGFEQYQALVRVKRIDSPAELITRQCAEVVFQVFPTKRELETSFAAGISMACARIAPRFREDRHDIIAKAQFRGVQVTGGVQKYFFYVQQWGSPEGPGSERWGDSTLLFELPYSVAGAAH